MKLIQLLVAALDVIQFHYASINEQAELELVAQQPQTSAPPFSPTPNFDNSQRKSIACKNASTQWIRIGSSAEQAINNIISTIQTATGMSGSGRCELGLRLFAAGNIVLAFQLHSESSCGYNTNWVSVITNIRELLNETPKSVPREMCIVASDNTGSAYTISIGIDASRVGTLYCHQGMEAEHCHWSD
ncbi:hypothetical protein DICA2_C05974 [Diutina catenulata]